MTAAVECPVVVERLDPAEFPNCVALLARARWLSASGLPDPLGAIDAAASAAIDASADLIRLSAGLGWDAAVRDVMATFPEVVR